MPTPKSNQYDLSALDTISGGGSNSLYSPTFEPLVTDEDLGITKSDPIPKRLAAGVVQAGANLVPSAANQMVNATMGLPGIIQLLSNATKDPVGTRNAASEKVKQVVDKLNTPRDLGNVGGPEGILGDIAAGVGSAISKYDPRGGMDSPLSNTLRFDPAAPIADAASLYAMKSGGPKNLLSDTKEGFGDLHQIVNDIRARHMLGQAKDTLNLRLGIPDSTVSDIVRMARDSGDSLPIPVLAGDKKAIEKLAGTEKGTKKLQDLTATQFGQAENLVQQKGLAPESQLTLTEGPHIASDKLRQRVNWR